jgi:uncharacterized membrane protein YfcA
MPKVAIYRKGGCRLPLRFEGFEGYHQLSWGLTVYAMTCVFAAAIVRGYSGFGFSLLTITSLSLMLPPAEIIPPIFMMEIYCHRRDALGFLAAERLVTWQGFIRFLAFVPALLAGQWIGARSFKTADPADFRRWILILLAALAVLTGLQGASGIVIGFG